MNPDLKTFTDGLEARTEDEAAMAALFLTMDTYPYHTYQASSDQLRTIHTNGSKGSRRSEGKRKKAAEKKARKNQRSRK